MNAGACGIHAVPQGGTRREASLATQGWPSFVGHSPWALRISPREAGLNWGLGA